ncbi:unnamed protein product [Ixodes pacificus]
MSSERNVTPNLLFKDLDGLHISSFLNEETVRSALSYKPRCDDIFIVTYQKAGTTWTQYIVHSILNDGVLPKDIADFMLRSPWLEFLGPEVVEKMARPGAIKCHLPFHKHPYSEKAKYIYVTRNPYDCCVSFYYHVRSIPHYRLQDAPFDTFLDWFLKGQVGCGDFFDHLRSWYEHRNDTNVLFLRYEDLIKDIKTTVLKIADFLGKEYGQRLREDHYLFDKLVKTTSFESMKKPINDGMKDLASSFLSIPPENQHKSIQVFNQRFCGKQELKPKEEFLRKGIVGDYKNHFSAEQIRRMKVWITSKNEGSVLVNLWNDIDLP